jgi:hypothetical protein
MQPKKTPVTWPDIHALSAQIGALEVRAGVFERLAHARLGDLGPGSPNSAREMLDDKYAPGVRAAARDLYFGVEDIALRMELIRKQREFERAYRAVYEDAIAIARKAVVDAEGRDLPGLRIGLATAICVALGAVTFRIYGAIAGALVGFFIGLSLMDRARRLRAEKLRDARATLDEELETRRREYTPQRYWFSEHEERTGQRDGSLDTQADLDTPGKRSAAYDSLAHRAGDFEVFRMQSDARPGWAELLTAEQIANFGISDNFEPISNERYLAGLAEMRKDPKSGRED